MSMNHSVKSLLSFHIFLVCMYVCVYVCLTVLLGTELRALHLLGMCCSFT
jgi:hypothetical protein